MPFPSCLAAPSCCSSKPKSCLPEKRTAFRYRRSTQTKAPRKRTFIANMQKQLIEVSLPSGLEGESFFGASTLCVTAAPCWCRGASGVPTVGAMGSTLPFAAVADDSNGNGRGNGRMGGMGGGPWEYNNSGDFEGDDSLSATPVLIALAFAVALYPALEYLAPPTAVAVVVAATPAELPIAEPAVAAAAPAPGAAAGGYGRRRGRRQPVEHVSTEEEGDHHDELVLMGA